jgi:hypothetical protein
MITLVLSHLSELLLLASVLPELAPALASGCRGFKGPVPPPL